MNLNKNRHMVDLLFVITLFLLFAVSSMALVAVGANVYESSVQNMEDNFTERTAYQYIAEKIHQYDRDGRVKIEAYGESSALALSTTVGEDNYVTYIYLYDGYLKELVVKKGAEVDPSSGQNVLEADAFSVTWASDRLINVAITVPGHDEVSFYVSIRTERGES